ncbi:hypothetical protein TRVL_10211 [Trypanosoma vivax]|nr:hypothetical protein TRVL_10211 [Trypanosoma vivax]
MEANGVRHYETSGVCTAVSGGRAGRKGVVVGTAKQAARHVFTRRVRRPCAWGRERQSNLTCAMHRVSQQVLRTTTALQKPPDVPRNGRTQASRALHHTATHKAMARSSSREQRHQTHKVRRHAQPHSFTCLLWRWHLPSCRAVAPLWDTRIAVQQLSTGNVDRTTSSSLRLRLILETGGKPRRVKTSSVADTARTRATTHTTQLSTQALLHTRASAYRASALTPSQEHREQRNKRPTAHSHRRCCNHCRFEPSRSPQCHRKVCYRSTRGSVV